MSNHHPRVAAKSSIQDEYGNRIRLTWWEVLYFGLSCFAVVWLAAWAYEAAAVAGGMQ